MPQSIKQVIIRDPNPGGLFTEFPVLSVAQCANGRWPIDDALIAICARVAADGKSGEMQVVCADQSTDDDLPAFVSVVILSGSDWRDLVPTALGHAPRGWFRFLCILAPDPPYLLGEFDTFERLDAVCWASDWTEVAVLLRILGTGHAGLIAFDRVGMLNLVGNSVVVVRQFPFCSAPDQAQYLRWAEGVVLSYSARLTLEEIDTNARQLSESLGSDIDCTWIASSFDSPTAVVEALVCEQPLLERFGADMLQSRLDVQDWRVWQSMRRNRLARLMKLLSKEDARSRRCAPGLFTKRSTRRRLLRAFDETSAALSDEGGWALGQSG